MSNVKVIFSEISSYFLQCTPKDQDPVILTLKSSFIFNNSNPNKKIMNYLNLKNDLKEVNWNVININNNVDVVTETFITTLNTAISKKIKNCG